MDIENVFVCDCETDGFLEEATKIHVFGMGYFTTQGWKYKATADYEDMKKILLNESYTLVFHNGYLFDKKVLEKILKIKIKAIILDSLPLSWVLFPNRIKEGKRWGLESFGETYGFVKPEITSWTDLTYEDYKHRVIEDVKINTALWLDCLDYLYELYEGNKKRIESFLNFCNAFMEIVAEQEELGIKLDIQKAQEFLEELLELAKQKEDILKTILPHIPIKRVINFPKNGLFKKDGSLSVQGQKYLNHCKELNLSLDYKEPLEIVIGYEDPNPTSVSQIKDYLFSKNWEPEIFIESISTTGQKKLVPQIKDKEKNLCKSVLKLVKEIPELQALEDLSVILHRASYLKAFLKNVRKDGYIEAQMSGLTNTMRLKHKNLVNLPSVNSSYGKYVRGVLCCEEGEYFVGSDLSSLENYTRTNFISEIQPDAIQILEDPEYDSHTQLAIFAGLMEQAEEDFFKWYKKGKNKESTPQYAIEFNEEEISSEFQRLNQIRQKSKVVSYSALYGIGKTKLAKELKVSEKEAKQLLDGYWRLNNAVKIFAESCQTKVVRGQMWVLNPGNGYYYSLRSEKDIFSTVNQSFGSYLHILWCKNMRKLGVKIRGNWHDEIVTTCKKENYDRLVKALNQAIETTNKQAKLIVPLKIDIQKGMNYAQVH